MTTTPMPTLGVWSLEDIAGQEDAAEAVQLCVGYALRALSESDVPWDHGKVMVAVGCEDRVVAVIVSPDDAIKSAPWLNDEQRELVLKKLPIDQRRIAAVTVEGHVSTMVYYVPGGTTSN